MKKYNHMKILAIICWSIFLLYLGINIIVGAHPVSKELLEGRSVEEDMRILDEWRASPLTKAQSIMLPIWRYNRFIYPVLVIISIFVGYKAFGKASGNTRLPKSE
ncbi:MAG: hypothetical protein IAF00_09775 [Phycisphaerales bacterium]|nr:hypothetical protein [Phycisphaerales bacterium]